METSGLYLAAAVCASGVFALCWGGAFRLFRAVGVFVRGLPFIFALMGGGAFAGPGWWAVRGMSTADAPDDFAPLTTGQLKTLFLGAVREIEIYLPGGAGSEAWALADRFEAAGIGEVPDDFGPANLGQLKYLGSLVYRRLIEEGVVERYPWEVEEVEEEDDGGSSVYGGVFKGITVFGPGYEDQSSTAPRVVADDFAPANIGQAKYVFSFDLSADTDGNGIPDLADAAWYLRASADGTLWIWPGSLDSDGDGSSDWSEMSERRSSPWDFYDGERPVVEWRMPLAGAEDLSASGRGIGYVRAVDEPGGVFSRDVQVAVRHADGRPWGGAPLWLRMARWDADAELGAVIRDAGGERETVGSGSLAAKISTDGAGEGAFRFQFPDDAVYTLGWEMTAGRTMISGGRMESGTGGADGTWDVNRTLVLGDGMARYTVRVRDGAGNPVPFADLRMEISHASGVRFAEGRTDVHGNFEFEFRVIPRKDRCGRDFFGVSVKFECGRVAGVDYAGEEPTEELISEPVGRGVVMELIQPSSDDWVDGGVWHFFALFRVEVGGMYNPCTGETTLPEGVTIPSVSRVTGRVWNGFGEAAVIVDEGGGGDENQRLVGFTFSEPVRWEWHGENWMQMDVRIEVTFDERGKTVIEDYSAGSVKFPFHPSHECDVVYMLSGHPWDWIKFSRASWRVAGGWRLKEGSDAVGIFEDPDVLATPFYAEQPGTGVLELEVGGDVIWEKPICVKSVVPRSAWGAVPARTWEMATMDRIQGITFHHSSNKGDGPEEMRRIQLMQMKIGFFNFFRFKERFSDIAYHFLLDRSGQLYQGRELEANPGQLLGPFTVGSHVEKANTPAGIGVCMMADYDGPEVFTRERQQALEAALTAIARRYGVSGENILGHQERALSHTKCPGHVPMLRTIEIRKNVERNLK